MSRSNNLPDTLLSSPASTAGPIPRLLVPLSPLSRVDLSSALWLCDEPAAACSHYMNREKKGARGLCFPFDAETPLLPGMTERARGRRVAGRKGIPPTSFSLQKDELFFRAAKGESWRKRLSVIYAAYVTGIF
nr:unnamed protein product [Digitaria exilis]